MGDKLVQAILEGRISLDDAIERYRPPTMGERIGGAAKNLYRGATDAVLQGNAGLMSLEAGALDLVGLDEAAGRMRRASSSMSGGAMQQDITGAVGQPAPQLENQGWLGKGLTQDLPSAAGSSLGMALVPGPKGVRAPAIAVRGALVGAGQGYHEALAMGASDAEAWASWVGNAALGLTEAGLPGLPKGAQQRLGDILARANKATGGELDNFLWRGVKTAYSEVTQEALQQVGSNTIAKALYDDDRKFLEGVAPAARGSALFGLIVGALAGGKAGPGARPGASPAPTGDMGTPTGDTPGGTSRPLSTTPDTSQPDPAGSGAQGESPAVVRPRLALDQIPPEHAEAVKQLSAGSQALGWQGTVHPVDAVEADAPVREFVERRGARLQLVESEDGAPLPRPAMYSPDGAIVAVDVNSPDAFSSLVDHEIGHHVLETVPGARESFEASVERIAPELRAMAAAEYQADLIRQAQIQAGRDLEAEEIAQLQQQVPPDDGLTRIAEDFSPVVRLLRQNPEAFSKVDDVGFWRNLVRAVLDVGRSLTGKPSAQEQKLAQLYRSIARTPLAAKLDPARGIEIATAVRDFLDSAVGQAMRPVGEAAGSVAPAEGGPAVEGGGAPMGPVDSPESPPSPDPAESPPSPFVDARLELPEARDDLLALANEAGWEQEGGQLIFSQEGDAKRRVIGRTKWIPKADWWRGRPDRLNEEQVRSAVKRATAGEKLSKAEERTVAYMLDVRDERAQRSGGGLPVSDMMLGPRDEERAAIQAEGEFENQPVAGVPFAAARRPAAVPLGPQRPETGKALGIIPKRILTREYIQDTWRPVRKLVEAAEQIGAVDDLSNVYQQEELRKGKTKDRIDRETKAHVAPLVDAIKRSGLDVDDVELYLMARHAHERNALILARTGKPDGSGMSDKVANPIIAKANASPKAAAYQDIAAKFDGLTKRTRDLWVEYGLESQDLVNALENQFTKYAPLRSELDDEGQPRGVARQIRGREFKAALGRGTVAENPLIYATLDLEKAIARGERNNVHRSLYELAKQVNDPNLMLVDVPPTKDALVNGVVRKVPDFQEAENEVLLKLNGELRRVRFPREYAAIPRAIKGLDIESGGAITELMGKLSRAIAGLSTRWNPFFPPVNLVRDVLGAALNAQNAALLNPARLAWAAKEIATNGPWAQRFRASGAPVAFMDLSPQVIERARQLRREIEDARTGPTAKNVSRRYAAKVMEGISRLNDVAEGMTRLNAFRHAVEDLGMSEDQAASFAKNITTNFERKGQAAWVNAWFAFSNAGIQSLARTGQTLKKPGARKLAAALMAGAFALDMLNRSAGGDDEDGIPYYDKIPDYIRRSHAIVMLPGTGGDYLKIPLPFVWGWAHVLGGEMARAASTGEVGRGIGNTTTALIDTVNPLGGGGEPLETITPTALDPLVQVASGKNFAGRDIYPTAFGQKPDSELAWDDTNAVLVEIARWLNRATGGSRGKAGLVDVSPLTMEHLIRSYLGGVGGELGRITDVGEKIASGDDTTFSDWPLWRRFVGEIALKDQRAIYKEHVAKVGEAVALEKAEEPYDENLYRLRLRANGWRDRIGDLEDEIRATDDVEEKREKRAELRETMLEAIKTIRESQQ